MKKYFKPYYGTLGRKEFIISIFLSYVLLIISVIGCFLLIAIELSKYPTGTDFLGIEEIPIQTKLLLLWDRAPFSSIISALVIFYSSFCFFLFCWEKRLAQIIKDRIYTTALVLIAWAMPTVLAVIMSFSGKEPHSFQLLFIGILIIYATLLLIISVFRKGKYAD